MKRAEEIKMQLAVLDKMAMAQAAADQQRAALLASTGMNLPSVLQQAAAVNALLLSSSLATQSLTPLQLGSLVSAQALAPLQAASLALAPQLNALAPLANLLSQPSTAPQAPAASYSGQENKVEEYRDASLLPDPVVTGKSKGRAEPFPAKIHRMLSELEEQEGGTDIASFLPHGRAFIIHKPKKFTEEVMPKYFRMSRFSSFQRQLNLCKFAYLCECSLL